MKVEFARANSKTRPDHAAGRTRALIERAAQIQLQILSMRSTDSWLFIPKLVIIV